MRRLKISVLCTIRPFPLSNINFVFSSNRSYTASSMVTLISNLSCCCLIVVFFCFSIFFSVSIAFYFLSIFLFSLLATISNKLMFMFMILMDKQWVTTKIKKCPWQMNTIDCMYWRINNRFDRFLIVIIFWRKNLLVKTTCMFHICLCFWRLSVI